MEPHKKADYATALCHAVTSFFNCPSSVVRRGFAIQLGCDVIPKKQKREKGESEWKPAMPWITSADVSKIKLYKYILALSLLNNNYT